MVHPRSGPCMVPMSLVLPTARPIGGAAPAFLPRMRAFGAGFLSADYGESSAGDVDHDATGCNKDDPLPLSSPSKASSSPFHTTLRQYYPTALTSERTANQVLQTLQPFGFSSQNTLFATSICSDEINFDLAAPKSLCFALLDAFGGSKMFHMGGLGGIPFVGRTGLGAEMDHIPYHTSSNNGDDGADANGNREGNLMILYASHVGISDEGKVGEVERCGQGGHGHTSTACGAAIAAYNMIRDHNVTAFHHTLCSLSHDEEEMFIVRELAKRLTKIHAKDYPIENHMAFVSYQMFDIVRDVLHEELTCLQPHAFEHCRHMALLGGIIINRFDSEDYFQPLSLELKTRNDPMPSPTGALMHSTNLYESAFGPMPRLEML